MEFPILLTKIIPPSVREGMVIRSRLIQQLDEACLFGLVLVSAPAGFGKTTLLVNWSQQSQLATTWVLLEEADNDPIRFLSYLTAALDRVAPGLQNRMQPFWGDVPFQQEHVQTELLNGLVGADADIVLILEDYHTIKNPEIHRGMMFFLDHLPPRLHIILSTRSDPALSFSRLRGRGQLAEIRTADLRFNQAECRELLIENSPLGLTGEQVGVLGQRTEGWAAGLHMAKLSIQRMEAGHVNEFIANLNSSHRFVLDYLTDEVLNSLDADIQSFLMETCILEKLTASLCDAVTGRQDSEMVLDQMERDNLFLFALDEERRWYRYHSLFRDLLQKRLASQDSERLASLSLKASRWMEMNYMFPEAIDYAIAGRDMERACKLVETDLLDILLRGEFNLARRWLEEIPMQFIQERPLLQLSWAWTHILPGEWDEAEKQIVRIQDSIAARQEHEDSFGVEKEISVSSLQGYLTLLQATIARGRGESTQKQLELVQRALSQVPQQDLALRAVVELRSGTCYLDFGEEEQAMNAFRIAEELAWKVYSANTAIQAIYIQAVIVRRRGNLLETAQLCREGIRKAEGISGRLGQSISLTGILKIMLGTVLVELHDLETAEEVLRQGLRLIEPISQYWEIELQVKGYYALARLNLYRGGNTVLPELKQMAAYTKPILGAYASALEARLQLLQAQSVLDEQSRGNLINWASGVSMTGPQDQPIDWLIYEKLVSMRIHADYWAFKPVGAEALFNLSDDLELIAQYIHQVDSLGWADLGIEAHLVHARLRLAMNQEKEALESLASALQLGEARGYVQVYLDEGKVIVPLLYQLAANGILPEFVGKLLAIFSADDSKVRLGQRDHLIEPLTSREIDVLRAIAAGLSNQEIGQHLAISVGTVKRHTANINRKLDVHSRLQAVMRARRLGILEEN